MIRIVAILIALSLMGCAGFGSNLSADQIKASAGIKDANVVCVQGVGPWGKANTIFVNIDKGVVAAGGVSVNSECQVVFQNGVQPK